MSRAQDAFDQLEAAAVTLAMCAMYCQEPDVLPAFREHWLARTARTASSPEAAARSRESVEVVDEQVLTGAVTTVRMFLDGFGDRLRAVPDEVLAAIERLNGS